MLGRTSIAILLVGVAVGGCRATPPPPDPAASASEPAPREPLPTGPLHGGESVDARVDAIFSRVELTSSTEIQAAERLVVELGPAAIPSLVAQLGKTLPKPPGGIDRRYIAARALRTFGAAARPAIPYLTPLLGGPEHAIPQPNGGVVVSVIENGELRNASAEALGSIGAESIPALTDVLRGSDGVARTKAASALEYMPPGSLEQLDAAVADRFIDALVVALPAILEELTRQRAIDAIARLPRPSAVKAIPALRTLGPEGVRVADELARP